MADNRPSVYLEGDTAIYRASAIGNQCHAQLVACRLGYQPLSPPAWLLDRYNEGSAMEPIVIERLRREKGWVITGDGDDAQMELEIPVGPTVKIRLHPDGLATIPEIKVADWVLEVKGFGDDYWEKFVKHGIEAFPGYVVQTALEMAATGRPCAFVVAHKPGRMEDKTIDANDYWESEIRVQYVEQPLVSLGEIKKKVIAVEMAAKKNELPSCSGGFFPCGYPQLHEEKPHDESEVVVDPMVDAAADYLEQCRLSKKSWEDREKVAREALMEKLAGRDKVVTKRFTVSLTTSQRSNFDKKALAAEHPELVEKYTTKSTVETLRVEGAK